MSCDAELVAAFAHLGFMKSGVDISSSPRALRCAFSAALQEGHGGDAGDFDRILEGEEHALGGALIGAISREVLAVEQDLAIGDFIARLAGEHIGERRLAGAVRAHDRMRPRPFTVRLRPLQDLLSSTRTCRSFTSSNAVIFFPHGLLSTG
jgi:hypothetical protein